MGFGLLFTGYVLTFFVSLVKYGYVIRLAGYAIMAIALLKIREYGREFSYPLGGALVLTLYGIYDCVYRGADVLSYKLPDPLLLPPAVMECVDLISVVVFNLILLYSIFVITSKLELSKQRNSAIRNAMLVVLYLVLNLLAIGPLCGNETYIKYFGMPSFLIQLVWIALNAVLLFSCYMYICPEGDEDMPQQKSRFEIVNKLRDESDRRTEQAVQSTQEYIKRKQSEKIERMSQKQKKGKK